MTDLAVERVLKAPPATVFAYLTQSDHLLKWWGPEGMSVKEYNLDLSQQGVASFSTLVNAEGGLHKMSGVVTTTEMFVRLGFLLLDRASMSRGGLRKIGTGRREKVVSEQ
jgi:uncharacterized protein YndB with AHSA1/START domain